MPSDADRGFLIYLAAEAIPPVGGLSARNPTPPLRGAALGAAAGPVGVAAGAAASFVAEKAIDYFGPRIASGWLAWLRGKPRDERVAALSRLGTLPAEE